MDKLSKEQVPPFYMGSRDFRPGSRNPESRPVTFFILHLLRYNQPTSDSVVFVVVTCTDLSETVCLLLYRIKECRTGKCLVFGKIQATKVSKAKPPLP
jgi:hypothetical protein